MQRSQYTDKDKQIEYINQYYDQLQQEKLTNKRTIEEAIRRQNFECDQIQNIKSLNVPCQREVETPPRRIPIRHQEPEYPAPPPCTQFEPTISRYPQTNQTVQYQNSQIHYQEDPRYQECSRIPQNYYSQPPIEPYHEIRPNYNRFTEGDHRYVHHMQPNVAQGHFIAEQHAPPRPPMHCGDQNMATFNRNFAEKAPCSCQSHTKIPVRIIPTITNRTDELPVQDLRNQWLDTYNNARMERKNNMKKNR